ncbi:hypothetical protein EVAR_96757_1 [Eumeta japonica]|uniref:Uncharacterized protein n=1 Tax=Eumeta variegata TaxID=151549 RepID=A0A4C1Y1I0_EUMVA|nr:hypothetical protein EVAR_96757_1 [Eumeta japonica]
MKGGAANDPLIYSAKTFNPLVTADSQYAQADATMRYALKKLILQKCSFTIDFDANESRHDFVIYPHSDAKRIFDFRLSDAKIKEGVFDGPQVRSLMTDEKFDAATNNTELDAWLAFKDIVNILTNTLTIKIRLQTY